MSQYLFQFTIILFLYYRKQTSEILNSVKLKVLLLENVTLIFVTKGTINS